MSVAVVLDASVLYGYADGSMGPAVGELIREVRDSGEEIVVPVTCLAQVYGDLSEDDEYGPLFLDALATAADVTVAPMWRDDLRDLVPLLRGAEGHLSCAHAMLCAVTFEARYLITAAPECEQAARRLLAPHRIDVININGPWGP